MINAITPELKNALNIKGSVKNLSNGDKKKNWDDIKKCLLKKYGEYNQEMLTMLKSHNKKYINNQDEGKNNFLLKLEDTYERQDISQDTCETQEQDQEEEIEESYDTQEDICKEEDYGQDRYEEEINDEMSVKELKDLVLNNTKRVLIFGEVCSGKSALVNYLLGEMKAHVTPRFVPHKYEFDTSIKSDKKNHKLTITEFVGIQLHQDLNDETKEDMEKVKNDQLVILYTIDSSRPYFDNRNMKFVKEILEKYKSHKCMQFYFVFTKYKLFTGAVHPLVIKYNLTKDKELMNQCDDKIDYVSIDATSEINNSFTFTKDPRLDEEGKKYLINYIKEADFFYSTRVRESINQFFKDENLKTIKLNDLKLVSRCPDDGERFEDSEDEHYMEIQNSLKLFKDTDSKYKKLEHCITKCLDGYDDKIMTILTNNLGIKFNEIEQNISDIQKIINNMMEINTLETMNVLKNITKKQKVKNNFVQLTKLIEQERNNLDNKVCEVLNEIIFQEFEKKSESLDSVGYHQCLKFLNGTNYDYVKLIKSFTSRVNDDNYETCFKTLMDNLQVKNNYYETAFTDMSYSLYGQIKRSCYMKCYNELVSVLSRCIDNDEIYYMKCFESLMIHLTDDNDNYDDCFNQLLELLKLLGYDERFENCLGLLSENLSKSNTPMFFEVYTQLVTKFGNLLSSDMNNKLVKKIFNEKINELFEKDNQKIVQYFPEIFRVMYNYAMMEFETFEIGLQFDSKEVIENLLKYNQVMFDNRNKINKPHLKLMYYMKQLKDYNKEEPMKIHLFKYHLDDKVMKLYN